MKKTLFFGLMAAALGFTACSSDDDLSINNSNKKGMVLRATVEQPTETRATITDNEGVWQFAFAENDQISVTNTTISTYYTFTNGGTEFASEDAQATASDATWYAYFPSNEISLVGQSGTKDDVANKYALAGATASATTGKGGLSITMSPKVAILVINNQKGSIDINVKSSATKWVSGLAANADGFTVSTATSKQSILNATTTGTYYVAVPAGVQLAVKDGDKTIKSTGASGLTAGCYYNLTLIGYGKAYAKGPNCDVNWVQLWDGGPKFAEYNIGVTNGLSTSYGNYYSWGGFQNNNNEDYNTKESGLIGQDDTATKLWGDEWRMPTAVEFQELVNGENCNCTWTDDYNGVKGLLCTGKAGTAYENNSVFFPAAGFFVGELYSTGTNCSYWSSTPHFALRDKNSAMELVPSVQKILKTNGASVRAVFKDPVIGTAKATINGSQVDVNWVQLWKNGPKFAEFNVGAANNKAEDYGGYYQWGGSEDNGRDYNKGSSELSGYTDTATKLWGSNWRMPTKAEFDALLSNCDVLWTTVGGVNGCKFTGKGDYEDNSVFLPTAGIFGSSNSSFGYYWSSTPDGSDTAYELTISQNSNFRNVNSNIDRYTNYSVRAVLKE